MKEFWFKNGFEIVGPMTKAELTKAVKDGYVTVETFVRQGETGKWRRLTGIEKIQSKSSERSTEVGRIKVDRSPITEIDQTVKRPSNAVPESVLLPEIEVIDEFIAPDETPEFREYHTTSQRSLPAYRSTYESSASHSSSALELSSAQPASRARKTSALFIVLGTMIVTFILTVMVAVVVMPEFLKKVFESRTKDNVGVAADEQPTVPLNGWNGTRWGMTPSEVREVFPELQRIPLTRNPNELKLVIDQMKVDKTTFEVSFHFDDSERLNFVVLFHENQFGCTGNQAGPFLFTSLKQDLISKYGSPASCEPHIGTDPTKWNSQCMWLTEDKKVSIIGSSSCGLIPSEHVVIGYRPREQLRAGTGKGL